MESSPVNNVELIYPLFCSLYSVVGGFLASAFEGSDTNACPLFINAFCPLLLFAVILNLCGQIYGSPNAFFMAYAF